MRPAQMLPSRLSFLAFAWQTSGEWTSEKPAIAGLWFLYRFRPPDGFNEWRLPLIGA
jgi:hypothetical protein